MKFLTQTFRDPKHTGAIAPSSKRLANLIVESAQLEDVNTVVELGPGTGVFTERILQVISPEALCLAIEINRDFAAEVKEKYPKVSVRLGSAAHIAEYLAEEGKTSCDRVVSGLPWTVFEPELQEKLLSAIYASLSPEGLFVTFAYYPFNYLPNGRSFKKRLEEKFSSVVKTHIIPHFPPAFVYVCRK